MGSYFADVFENEWPGIPLHKEPNQLENDFNQLLMDITFLMSNGTLKNVSLFFDKLLYHFHMSINTK